MHIITEFQNTKTKLDKLKGKIDKSINSFGNFNSTLSTTNKTHKNQERQSIFEQHYFKNGHI